MWGEMIGGDGIVLICVGRDELLNVWEVALERGRHPYVRETGPRRS